MSYFSRFPLLGYTLDNNATYQVVSDVIKRVAVSQKTKENLVLFDDYDIRDGETPEIVSYKFYDSTDYHWVILLVNDIFDARFGWPLTDAQLFKYVQDKYGENNVGATHHYTLNQNSDIIVDPTQLTTVYSYPIDTTKNFPSNVDYLFEYAANGSSTASLTSAEQAFVSFLLQPSDESLPGSGVLYRGDMNHSFRTASPGALVSDVIKGVLVSGVITDNLILNTQTLNLDASVIYNPPGAPEFFNEHIVRHFLKPAVDSGNLYLIGYLGQSVTRPTNAGVYAYNAYYANNLYYRLAPGANTSVVISSITRIGNNQVWDNPLTVDRNGVLSYLREPVQYYYDKGDITRTTWLSGVRELATSDANVALQYYRGSILPSNSYYDTISNLLSEMEGNTLISSILTDPITRYEKQTSYVLSYPNAYAVSNLAYEEEKNEAKRRIRVLKAEYLNAFITEFQSLINA